MANPLNSVRDLSRRALLMFFRAIPLDASVLITSSGVSVKGLSAEGSPLNVSYSLGLRVDTHAPDTSLNQERVRMQNMLAAEPAEPCVVLTQSELRGLLNDAYLAGWSESGDDYNGDLPADAATTDKWGWDRDANLEPILESAGLR